MMRQHLALIVEDDAPTSEDLAQIVESTGCETRTATNKCDALTLLDQLSFCFVLLDLQIKADADSIKGHVANGNALLREIRSRNSAHTGRCWWLPVLIVSGYANEVTTAVDVMKHGATDIIHKPFVTGTVTETIHRALAESRRENHESCSKPPPRPGSESAGQVILAIQGDRVGRRTRVTLGTVAVSLPDRALKLLLRLLVARSDNEPLHKSDLGARDDQGFKGVSELRAFLQAGLGDGVDIIENDYHGFYTLAPNVVLGPCDLGKLAAIGDARITELARVLDDRLRVGPKV
jgi:ActR/RegA family two-component response regulator